MPWLYKQASSRYWWIGDRIDGKPFFKSTKKENREDAEKELAIYRSMRSAKAANKLTDEFYEALTGKKVPDAALKPEVVQWLQECKASTGNRTYPKYKQIAEELLAHFKADDRHPKIKDITRDELFSMLSALRKTRSASTVNLMRNILSTFFHRHVKSGLLKTNPARAIKPFKAGRDEVVKRRVLTMVELKNIYDKAPDDFWRYMIQGGFYTSLRMGDLILLKAESVDLGSRLIKLYTGKTNKLVTMPIAIPFFESIKDRMASRKGREYLWPDQAALYRQRGAGPFSLEFREKILEPCGLVPKSIPWRQLKKRRKAIGVQVSEVVYHSLRHTMITTVQELGASKAVAMELAGHSDERVNANYTHVGLDEMRRVIDLIPQAV